MNGGDGGRHRSKRKYSCIDMDISNIDAKKKKPKKNVVFGICFVNIAWNSFVLFRKFCIVVSPIMISVRYHTRCYRITYII
jgi:hypothetical protein